MAKRAKKPLTANQRHALLMTKIRKMEADIDYIQGWMVPTADRYSVVCDALRDFQGNLQLFRDAETKRFELIRQAINTMYEEMPKAPKLNGSSAPNPSPPDSPEPGVPSPDLSGAPDR